MTTTTVAELKAEAARLNARIAEFKIRQVRTCA